mmetsp:Transcript_8611/g.25791  ORF Transcript_8611/g.25791 Transcript_8611/m.25791 type:complete len:219 (-) Transcript_8611:105-761(-)
MLTRRSRPAISLFPSPMTRQLRQMLTAYHISVFYLVVRLLGTDNVRWLFSRLSPAQGRRLPSPRGVGAMVLMGTVALDELVHAVARASVDGSRVLVGTLPPKNLEPPLCCICHDSDDIGEKLLGYCPSGLHPAHASCMLQWYNCGRGASHTCPVCRRPLVTHRRSLVDRVQMLATEPLFWIFLARRTAVTVLVAAVIWGAIRVLLPRLGQRPPITPRR